MQDQKPGQVFMNRRDWGSFLIAIQNAAGCPKMLEVVKSGREWFVEGASQASSWLVDSAAQCRDKFSIG